MIFDILKIIFLVGASLLGLALILALIIAIWLAIQSAEGKNPFQ